MQTSRLPLAATGVLAAVVVAALGCGRPDQTLEEGVPAETVVARSGEGDALFTHRVVMDEGGPSIQVATGAPDEARTYYKKINEHLEISGDLLSADLADLFRYCGYQLDPANVELMPSADLMKDPDVQATVFFAPKIVDASQTGTGDFRFGWRKLVRFRARAKSGADSHGISSLWLLFNYASEGPEFPGGRAGQIQAILEQGSDGQGPYPIYFFVFQDNAQGYGLGLSLNASFDNAGGANRDYYIPRACAQCHGDESPSMSKVKINYLDTDHWFDRVQVDEFAKVEDASVLPDGGVPGTDGFDDAFDVYRTLNEEIQAQVLRVDAGGFSDGAVTRWIETHAKSSAYVDVPQRAFGAAQWDPNNATDAELLPLLNQYCYRCHSSVRYHVFDKASVKSTFAASRVEFLIDLKIMPQDRELSPATRARMIELAKELLDQ